MSDTEELESWEYLPLSAGEITEATALEVELPRAEVLEAAPEVVVQVRQEVARRRTEEVVRRHTTVVSAPVSSAGPRRARR